MMAVSEPWSANYFITLSENRLLGTHNFLRMRKSKISELADYHGYVYFVALFIVFCFSETPGKAYL